MTTTTAAAIQAGVTVETIRTWCRRNVIGAAKVAGRWVIDTSSLAARIAIGAMKRPALKPTQAVFSIQTMTAIGGRRWQKNGHDRVYLNGWEDFADIEISRYNTGSISSALVGGRAIANSRAYGVLGAVDKVYFDAADGRLHFRHYGADAYEIRYLDGERNYLDLLTMITAGVRAAIVAL
ncbi:helix-turn-helix domain-containing protein [Streptomyces sp. NPDC087850]|uniref:helix-turn-helix domain-containing protein n=1 Tax=Streptomyces sp. NPDC087850 TaxID=3365809 RepID=UPI00380C9DEC